MIRNMASAENVLQPGKTYRVDADKFGAVKAEDFKYPRMDPATNPMPFDGMRLIYGGFAPVVELGAK